jgi:hypothetical protein
MSLYTHPICYELSDHPDCMCETWMNDDSSAQLMVDCIGQCWQREDELVAPETSE